MKLVTGCVGFIGSHLTEKLLERGYEVRGIDNFDDYYSPDLKKKRLERIKDRNNFEFIKKDIRDGDVSDILGGVNTIYHLAAIAGVRYSVKHPRKYFSINSFGTANLLSQCYDKVDRFVFSSSSSVYGDRDLDELPAKESHEPRPMAPYTLTKKQAEEVCNLFNEKYNLSTVNLRYFTVYGPRQRPDEAICKFTKLLLEDERPQIYGDGEQTRDFTYVDDIVKGTIEATETGAEGTYNLGSGKRISVNELVKLLQDEIGTDIEPKYVDKKPGDVRHTWADITKARDEFNYRPQTDIEKGIEKFVKWFKND